MTNLDEYEQEILDAYDQGLLKSTSPTEADLAKFKAAAATFIKESKHHQTFSRHHGANLPVDGDFPL